MLFSKSIAKYVQHLKIFAHFRLKLLYCHMTVIFTKLFQGVLSMYRSMYRTHDVDIPTFLLISGFSNNNIRPFFYPICFFFSNHLKRPIVFLTLCFDGEKILNMYFCEIELFKLVHQTFLFSTTKICIRPFLILFACISYNITI